MSMSHSRLSRRSRRVEERVRRIDVVESMPKKRLLDMTNPLEKYSAKKFQARYHVMKETALYITDLIKDELNAPVRRGVQIPALLQFLLAQRYLATNSFQLVIGDLVSITQPAVSKIVKRVAKAICKYRSKFIRWPTLEEAEASREGFLEIGGFPGVVGCIDGTHIGIPSPGGENAELFRNRKQYFSINVQIICDDKLNLLNLVARWYGSAHDMRIFENSSISRQLENGEVPGLLLGDSGYACLSYLLTPYPKPTTTPQINYNKSQILTRNCAERAIGCWKRRFPVLDFCRLKLSTCLCVIVATGVINNIARRRCDLNGDEAQAQPSVPCDASVRNVSGNRATVSGRQKRDGLIRDFFT